MTEQFKPLSRNKLEELYGVFYSNRVGSINLAEVPFSLRELIPYAEIWGISDDIERDELVEASPEIARNDLKALFQGNKGHEIDVWLAGSEADKTMFSKAYLAFSNMRIAYDYLLAL